MTLREAANLDRLCRIMGTFDLATGHASTMEEALDALESELRDVLGHLRTRREWKGLTDEEIEQGLKGSWVTEQAWQSAVWWAEAKLKEKNT